MCVFAMQSVILLMKYERANKKDNIMPEIIRIEKCLKNGTHKIRF